MDSGKHIRKYDAHLDVVLKGVNFGIDDGISFQDILLHRVSQGIAHTIFVSNGYQNIMEVDYGVLFKGKLVEILLLFQCPVKYM